MLNVNLKQWQINWDIRRVRCQCVLPFHYGNVRVSSRVRLRDEPVLRRNPDVYLNSLTGKATRGKVRVTAAARSDCHHQDLRLLPQISPGLSETGTTARSKPTTQRYFSLGIKREIGILTVRTQAGLRYDRDVAGCSLLRA